MIITHNKLESGNVRYKVGKGGMRGYLYTLYTDHTVELGKLYIPCTPELCKIIGVGISKK
jgi:hypothetical protein